MSDSNIPIITGPERQADFGNVDYSKTQGGRFYANHASANITLFDIRLVFSTVEMDAAQNKLFAQDTVTVMLSPELANFVHSMLGQSIATYTAKYGSLRLPPGALQPSEEKQE